MAYEPEAHSELAYSHVLNCPLHDNERTKTCSGYSKRGKLCINKAIESPVPGTLPMCKIHRTQLRVATFCRAQLPCGYDCGQLCEWRAHMFQMCPDHQDIPMTCYFFKISIDSYFQTDPSQHDAMALPYEKLAMEHTLIFSESTVRFMMKLQASYTALGPSISRFPPMGSTCAADPNRVECAATTAGYPP
jgi:hypothetical protein